jgi:hypothetical protein
MKKVISIQILPSRITTLVADEVVFMLYTLARKSWEIVGVKIEVNRDRSEYINIHYKTKNAKGTWKKIQSKILDNKKIGRAIKAGSIIICEGKSSWKDYLLLHHFNKNEVTDTF